ncbi:MAG: Tim44 domain-containing protein, partial [Burkholderiaceae bacterium]|nr:Tim44 domain-containing protein [Burkholderiaceae bacterium]
RLQETTALVAFFPSGVRENNTTVMSAMAHGCAVISNLDSLSPSWMKHGHNIFDINKLENFPDAAQIASVRKNAQLAVAEFGFDQIAFLANAKHYFTRLQKAWDAGDLEALREFTTPEMFASLQRDLQGRAEGVNHTDVVTLNAELLGVETDANTYLCSVEFSGLIREQAEGPAEPFREVWNLSKPVNGPGGWVLAGIQQLV